MMVFIFLLGGALGISLSSLVLVIQQVNHTGFTEDAVVDMAYECASILFVLALFTIYMQVQ